MCIPSWQRRLRTFSPVRQDRGSCHFATCWDNSMAKIESSGGCNVTYMWNSSQLDEYRAQTRLRVLES